MSLHLEVTYSANVGPQDLANLFAEALGASPEGVVIHGGDGHILACNAAASEILGLSIPEMLGRTSMDPRWQTIRPDGTAFPGGEHPVSITLRTGEAVRDTIMGVHDPEGVLRWIRITSWPLPIGPKRGAVAFFSDVTAARRLEQELRTAQDRLSMAVSAGGVGLWEWDLRTGLVWCDDGFARIVGLDAAPAAPSAERFFARVHPEDRTRAAVDLDNIAHGQPPSEVSYRIVRDDGAVRHVLGQGQVVAWDGDRAAVLAGVVVDVTESTAAADAVVHHLEAMSDAYFAVDHDWRFTYLNHRAGQLLGRRRDELLGRVVWEEFPEAVGSPFERSYRQALGSGVPVAFTAYYPPLERWFDVTATPGPVGLSIFFRDVTDRRAIEEEREELLAAERRARLDAEQAQEAIAHAAAHDDLTGLGNRAALYRFLDAGLAVEPTASLAVLIVDVDRFKLVNDAAGHAEGDRALKAIALRLRSIVSDGDMLARLGGDEFVIATTRAPDELEVLARLVVECFHRPLTLDGKPHIVTVSVGVASANGRSTTETLLRDADTALYRAKDNGRNQVCVFDEDLRRLVVRRLNVEQRLRTALDNGILGVEYQPIFNLSSEKSEAVEALCRWADAELGPVPPSEFIPVAEETGLIVPLGRLMRARAAEDGSALLEVTGKGGVVWVNASMLELDLPCVADDVVAVAEALPDIRLGLEVTESALRDDDRALEVLHRLADVGVQIAIDDFGTGYSSLTRLAKYPVDLLKIDRSFVAGLADDSTRSLVSAIVQMARAVGARTCAEGVETVEQLEALRSLHVDSVSGYLLARPSAIQALPTIAHSGELLLSSAAMRIATGGHIV